MRGTLKMSSFKILIIRCIKLAQKTQGAEISAFLAFKAEAVSEVREVQLRKFIYNSFD
jgi:hypothetical protein